MQIGCPQGHWVNEIDKVIVPYTILIHFYTGNGHNKIIIVIPPLEFGVPRQRGSALTFHLSIHLTNTN